LTVNVTGTAGLMSAAGRMPAINLAAHAHLVTTGTNAIRLWRLAQRRRRVGADEQQHARPRIVEWRAWKEWR
jgi:hypothetical protein